MADDEHITMMTSEKMRRQIMSPCNTVTRLSWGELVPKNGLLTIFLGHFRERDPTHVLREVKQIPDYRS